MANRKASVERETRETKVKVAIDLDGKGTSNVQTGNGMLDHLLDQVSRHGLIDLDIKASGDSDLTGWHHTVEDTAITLGQAFLKAVGDGSGIYRMGWALVPLDEALSQVVVDISGRGFAALDLGISDTDIGNLPGDMVRHFLHSFAMESKMTLHIKVLSGVNAHHIAEASFKGLAKALRQATQVDAKSPNSVPSTKGTISQ